MLVAEHVFLKLFLRFDFFFCRTRCLTMKSNHLSDGSSKFLSVILKIQRILSASYELNEPLIELKHLYASVRVNKIWFNLKYVINYRPKFDEKERISKYRYLRLFLFFIYYVMRIFSWKIPFFENFKIRPWKIEKNWFILVEGTVMKLFHKIIVEIASWKNFRWQVIG